MRLRGRFRDVIRFAVSVGVSPGIVVGQMQYREADRAASTQQLEAAIRLG